MEAKAINPAQYIFDWLRLFSYRSKILWAYRESQKIKHQMKDDFIVIQDCVKKLKKDDAIDPTIKELQVILDNAQNAIATYGIDLTYLDYQCRTIETNLQNYQIRLARIQEKAGEHSIQNMLPEEWVFQVKNLASRLLIPDTNLSDILIQMGNIQGASNLNFLKNFSDSVAQSWLLQVQKDYGSLSPGLSLLDSLTNTVRAVIEVDRGKRDRTFQNTVAILGVGLAAGSFVASIAGQFPGAGDTKPEQALKYPVGSTLSHLGVPNSWLVPTTSIVISLGVAIAFGTLTALVIKLSWLVRKLEQRSR